MPTICLPAVLRPEYKTNQKELINYIAKRHGEHPAWPKAQKVIENTEVEERYTIVPLDELISHTDIEWRNKVYEAQARKMSSIAASKAISNSGLKASDIRMVIVTSCTGFMMPSLTAHLINDLPLANDTVQLPVSQLGCVAGANAIARAYDFARQDSGNHVLIVAVEFASLRYQPDNTEMKDFVSSALFGDAVSGCVIRADDLAEGFRIKASASYTFRNSEHYIRYYLNNKGVQFLLDKSVAEAIEFIAPEIEKFNRKHLSGSCADNDVIIFHTGGRKILDELEIHLKLDAHVISLSRESLRLGGNVMSVVVFDVLAKQFARGVKPGSSALIAAFGPGFTTEMIAGEWINRQ